VSRGVAADLQMIELRDHAHDNPTPFEQLLAGD
jgi:hypothetical protein